MSVCAAQRAAQHASIVSAVVSPVDATDHIAELAAEHSAVDASIRSAYTRTLSATDVITVNAAFTAA